MFPNMVTLAAATTHSHGNSAGGQCWIWKESNWSIAPTTSRSTIIGVQIIDQYLDGFRASCWPLESYYLRERQSERWFFRRVSHCTSIYVSQGCSMNLLGICSWASRQVPSRPAPPWSPNVPSISLFNTGMPLLPLFLTLKHKWLWFFRLLDAISSAWAGSSVVDNANSTPDGCRHNF